MRSVESDIVKLNPNSHKAHVEAELALTQRFPNAIKWLLGHRTPGMLHGDQIGKIIKGEELEEVEEWQVDYDEVRALIRFLRNNWIDANRVETFGCEEWSTIYQALRYCAEEIGYLPKTKREDDLRESARELSGRLIVEGKVQTGNVKDLDLGELPFYDHDWVTILHACIFAYKNLSSENQEMMTVKANLERLTGEIAHRIKYCENRELSSYGIKDVEIYRRLDEIVMVPWEFKKNHEAEKELYRRFRSLQGEDSSEEGNGLCVLRFCIKEGAKIKEYDWTGEYLGEQVAESGLSYRDHDIYPQFNSDYFVIGKGKNNRLMVHKDDVTIRESHIHRSVSQVPEYLEYIYANYLVEKGK